MSKFALYDLATGVLAAERMDDEPQTMPEGKGCVRVPGSFFTGASVWSASTRGFVDPPPPPSRLDALIALLVSKGVITSADATALPE